MFSLSERILKEYYIGTEGIFKRKIVFGILKSWWWSYDLFRWLENLVYSPLRTLPLFKELGSEL